MILRFWNDNSITKIKGVIKIKQFVLPLLTGLVVGGIFEFIKLPVPAPPTLGGILGIIGIFLGFTLVKILIH